MYQNLKIKTKKDPNNFVWAEKNFF